MKKKPVPIPSMPGYCRFGRSKLIGPCMKKPPKGKPRTVRKMGGGKKCRSCSGRGLSKLMKAAKKVTPGQALGAARVVMNAAEKSSSGRQKDFLRAARLITSKKKKQRREGVDLAVGLALQQHGKKSSSD